MILDTHFKAFFYFSEFSGFILFKILIHFLPVITALTVEEKKVLTYMFHKENQYERIVIKK